MAAGDLGSIMDILGATIQEDLAFTEREIELEIDGIFSRIVNTSEGVERTSFGRTGAFSSPTMTFSKIVTFAVGVAGAYRNVDIRDPVMDTGAAGLGRVQVDQIHIGMKPFSSWRTFPGIEEQSWPGYVQKEVRLVQAMGSLAAPLAWFMESQLSSALVDAVALSMKGLGRNIAHAEVNSLYSNKPTSGIMQSSGEYPGALAEIVTLGVTVVDNDGATGTGAVGTTDDSGTSNTARLKFIDDSLLVGRVARFRQGMKVMIVDDDDLENFRTTGSVTKAVAYVTKVDPLNKYATIKLYDTAGAALAWSGVASGDFIIPHPGGVVTEDQVEGVYDATNDSAAFGPTGIEAWLTDSGTPFGIALSTWGQFKSLVQAINGVLDDTMLNKYIGGFFDAYGAMYDLDTLIGTTGILTAYLDSVTPLYHYQRQGERLKMKEGWASLDYAYQGKEFEFLVSRYQRAKQLWILKMGDGNIQRLEPPPIPGTSGRGDVPGMVQFVNPFFGQSGIWSGARGTNSALVEAVEAPFLVYREYTAEQLPGIKLTGITELNP